MATQTTRASVHDLLPHWGNLDNIPILYEDEDEVDMGESNPHVVTNEILHVCVKAHLANQPAYQVFADMNLYYRDGPPHKTTGSKPYVSPDVMVVEPFHPLEEDLRSYTIGKEGPAPLCVTETLSERSAQQRDLKEKVIVYAKLSVAEYILVDLAGKFLPERLLLKRLQPDRTYTDVQDSDGGVTSQLGFRLIVDDDGQLRVLDVKTGKRYVRPDEAEEVRRQAEEARRQAEEMARVAEQKLQALQKELRRKKPKKK